LKLMIFFIQIDEYLTALNVLMPTRNIVSPGVYR
jgi:hypothetical protein